MKRLALALIGCLALGCASASVSENRLINIPADATVALSSAVMDTPERLDTESTWLDAIRRGFNDEAAELGILGGSLPVEIRVTHCHPGSKAARYWIGFGAGKGSLESEVAVRGHGQLLLAGSVSMGFFGGSFEDVCEKAGRAAARAIGEARGK